VRFRYYNQSSQQAEDTSIILVDVVPHLLHHLLLNTIPRYRERAQLAFKVALGCIHAYSQNSVVLGLPISFILPPLKQFVKRVLCETQVSEPSYQFVYACLTLVNTLLVSDKQKENMLRSSIEAPASASGLVGFAVKTLPASAPATIEQGPSISPFKSSQRK